MKEEAAMEIKTDVSHVESAIPKINIQIEEAPGMLFNDLG